MYQQERRERGRGLPPINALKALAVDHRRTTLVVLLLADPLKCNILGKENAMRSKEDIEEVVPSPGR